MLIQHGFLEVHELIRDHARHRAYAASVFNQLIGTADTGGLVSFEADELAETCRVPRALVYSVLLDLEREPIAAITRQMKGRHVRGAQLTTKVHHKPAPRPERRPRAVAAA